MLIAVQLQAHAVMPDRRINVPRPQREVTAAQGEVRIVGTKRIRGPVSLIRAFGVAAFGQHVAELHPDSKIIGPVAQVAAIVFCGVGPPTCITSGIRLDGRPPYCSLSPIRTGHAMLAIMPEGRTKQIGPCRRNPVAADCPARHKEAAS